MSDTALHRDCLATAKRWCPELKRSEYQPLEVDRPGILAEELPLDSFSAGDAGDEWGTYGDRVRRWSVAMPKP
ncbi:hypothetical protein ACWCPQ_32220 [Nocardia sp. NPDC001965]